MIGFDDALRAELTQKVAEIEVRTDAEVVVCLAGRAGRYDDLPLRAAAVACTLALVVLVAIPLAVPPVLFTFGVLGAGSVTLAGSTWMGARLVPPARLDAEVLEAAQAAFVDLAVHGTPRHNGVLVYVAAYENRVVVVPDLALQGQLGPGALVPSERTWARLTRASLLAGLDALGEALAQAAPHLGEASRAFNLPNEPRVRP